MTEKALPNKSWIIIIQTDSLLIHACPGPDTYDTLPMPAELGGLETFEKAENEQPHPVPTQLSEPLLVDVPCPSAEPLKSGLEEPELGVSVESKAVEEERLAEEGLAEEGLAEEGLEGKKRRLQKLTSAWRQKKGLPRAPARKRFTTIPSCRPAPWKMPIPNQ